MIALENIMQVALTISSMCYVLLSSSQTIYRMKLTRYSETKRLTLEAVSYIWFTFVKMHKVHGTWSYSSKRDAYNHVIEYVRRNESCYCKICCRVSDEMIIEWIKEDISLQSQNKSYCTMDVMHKQLYSKDTKSESSPRPIKLEMRNIGHI